MTPEQWLANVRAEREEIALALRKVSEYADQPISTEPGCGSLGEYVRQLVRDHEELEARIEAVLTMTPVEVHNLGRGHEGDPPEAYLDRDEVHRLLRGGTRVPDTIKEITGG